MVAVDGSQKISSNHAFVKLKLSKVATAPVALMKLIALPAADTVPPPEAMIDGAVPPSAKATEDACEVVTLSAPVAVTVPAVACTPVEEAPETVIDVSASVVIAPPVVANRPVFEAPLSPIVVAPESVTVLPEPLASTPPAPAPPLMVTPNVLPAAVVMAPPADANSP